MFLDLSPTDLSLLVRGLTELLHGELLSEAEWADRMGESRASAVALLARLGQAHSAQLLSSTGAMQDMVLAGFGGTPPSELEVAELAERAIGPENATLRAALQHYGLFRALGPGWIDALEQDPVAHAAIPPAIWTQMRQFLARPEGAQGEPGR